MPGACACVHLHQHMPVTRSHQLGGARRQQQEPSSGGGPQNGCRTACRRNIALILWVGPAKHITGGPQKRRKACLKCMMVGCKNSIHICGLPQAQSTNNKADSTNSLNAVNQWLGCKKAWAGRGTHRPHRETIKCCQKAKALCKHSKHPCGF